MTVKIISLSEGSDEASIQAWLDAHPNIQIAHVAMNGNYCVILYNA